MVESAFARLFVRRGRTLDDLWVFQQFCCNFVVSLEGVCSLIGMGRNTNAHPDAWQKCKVDTVEKMDACQ